MLPPITCVYSVNSPLLSYLSYCTASLDHVKGMLWEVAPKMPSPVPQLNNHPPVPFATPQHPACMFWETPALLDTLHQCCRLPQGRSVWKAVISDWGGKELV